MALTAIIYNFSIELADVDRGVYESLTLKVAQHPSETEERLLTRVLAYCLEYTDGIAFSKGGISDPDEPAITVRDLTGALKVWIEVGAPDAARLHKASKAAQAVLDRRMTFALSVTDGHLFVSHAGGSLDGAVTTLSATSA